MTETPEIDESLPEVVKNFLRRGARLESIRLDDLGNWTHEGLRFENPRIIELFDRSVGRTEGGTWILEIGQFTYPIEVDDTGFFVRRVSFDPTTTLLLSDGTREDLDPTTLQYAAGGRLYCQVKDGRFRARFQREAYYAMADRIEDTSSGWIFDGSWAIETVEA